MRKQARPRANLYPITNDTMRADPNSVRNYGVVSDDGVGVERNPATNQCTTPYESGRVHYGYVGSRRIQQRKKFQQGSLGLVDHDARRHRSGRFCERSRYENDAGRRRFQRPGITAVCKKADLVGAGPRQRRNASNHCSGFPLQLSADKFRNGESGERARALTAFRPGFRPRRSGQRFGAVTPAGWGLTAPAAAGFGAGAAFTRARTFCVMSRLLSAATITLVCDATSKIIA